MQTAVSLFVRTLLIGIAVAAPVGAMGVLCIQRTLDRGWRIGAATGLGIATADGIYAGLAAFGVTALSQALVAWQDPLQLVGGLALVVIGGLSMVQGSAAPDSALSISNDCDASAAPDPRYAGSEYLSAVALTLTNPMTIMAFGAVFASAGLTAAPTLSSAAIATLGVATGSFAWWIGLTSLVVIFKRGLGDALVVWVRRISGFVIVAFGVLAVVMALT